MFMQAIKDVIAYLMLEVALIIIDFFIYYSNDQTVGPLIVGLALTFIVLVITVFALLESIKHRNDKEPW